jgi:carbon storage regulator
MLVLSRKFDESIMIGDSVVIKVLAIQDGQVKIGIEAPKDVRILRREIYEEIHKSNAQAAKASKGAAMKAAKMLQTKIPPGDSSR